MNDTRETREAPYRDPTRFSKCVGRPTHKEFLEGMLTLVFHIWDPSYEFADSFPANHKAHTLFRLLTISYAISAGYTNQN